MRKAILASLLMLFGFTYALWGEPGLPSEAASRQQWVSSVLKQIETIKVGMTRQDLLKVFTTEGGISTRHQRTYVHKECGYIKVDVEFKSVGQEDQKLKELPADQITVISRPYLQWSIGD